MRRSLYASVLHSSKVTCVKYAFHLLQFLRGGMFRTKSLSDEVDWEHRVDLRIVVGLQAAGFDRADGTRASAQLLDATPTQRARMTPDH
eukprot:7379201-Prymnesium_polylepis.1